MTKYRKEPIYAWTLFQSVSMVLLVNLRWVVLAYIIWHFLIKYW